MNGDPSEAMRHVAESLTKAIANMGKSWQMTMPAPRFDVAFKPPAPPIFRFTPPTKDVTEERRKARSKAIAKQLNAERRGEGPKKNRHERRAAARKGKR